MKTQFNFNGRAYIAPNKKEAKAFIKYWDSFFTRPFRLKTTWKIKHVEHMPSWVLTPVIDTDQIEYEKA